MAYWLSPVSYGHRHRESLTFQPALVLSREWLCLCPTSRRQRSCFLEEATEDFRQGLEADPINPRNLIGLGYCYVRSGQPVMAQRQFSTVLEQIPDEPGALTGMGLAHLRLGNKAAAAQLFRRVLELSPENEEVRGYLHQAEAP